MLGLGELPLPSPRQGIEVEEVVDVAQCVPLAPHARTNLRPVSDVPDVDGHRWLELRRDDSVPEGGHRHGPMPATTKDHCSDLMATANQVCPAVAKLTLEAAGPDGFL